MVCRGTPNKAKEVFVDGKQVEMILEDFSGY